jgi:orotidine-5'-phosphate decarboxylase
MKPCMYIALDGMQRGEALILAKKLLQADNQNAIAGFKIHDLFDRYGSSIVKDLKKLEKEVWLDLKLHDTPNTITFRLQALKEAGADIVTVHASSGVWAIKQAAKCNLKIVLVTVLTSLAEIDVKDIYNRSTKTSVKGLVEATKHISVYGYVCSYEEIQLLSSLTNKKRFVPGIRLKKEKDKNQNRTGTPKAALEAGADFLVIGSEITKAKDPLEVFRNIVEEI